MDAESAGPLCVEIPRGGVCPWWMISNLLSTYKEDLKSSSAELVYGEPLRLPGDFFQPDEESTVDMSDYVARLQLFVRQLQPSPASRNGSQKSSFIFEDLATAPHIFLRDDAGAGCLKPAYTGPHESSRTRRQGVQTRSQWSSISSHTASQHQPQGSIAALNDASWTFGSTRRHYPDLIFAAHERRAAAPELPSPSSEENLPLWPSYTGDPRLSTAAARSKLQPSQRSHQTSYPFLIRSSISSHTARQHQPQGSIAALNDASWTFGSTRQHYPDLIFAAHDQ
ncbi:unnamed protein product [Chilo suppressalis]|uniref:Uncharacterized protein n=1 Tax=Chilo suppressalis TaxID=168631 RepID=A0ABN8B695_CHISP|nr:unnamed protein product [Chilo suppressalis]